MPTKDFSYQVYEFIQKNTTENVAFINQSKYRGIFISPLNVFFHCIELSKSQEFDAHFYLELTKQYQKEAVLVIHLWEDQWVFKHDIVKSRIISLLKKSNTIPARLSKVERIDKATLETFIEANHLNINVQAKFKYGLFLPKNYYRILQKPRNEFAEKLFKQDPQNEKLLIAIASFSGARKITRNGQVLKSHELIRFANLKGFTVVGGLQKLMSAFAKDQNPQDLVSYADRDWSDGHSYHALGFELIDEIPPQMFLVNPLSYERFYSNRIDDTHFLPVWNTGSLKFLKVLV